MKMLVQMLFLGCVFATASAQTPQPDCSKWNVMGYRIGMTRAEAIALHGGKFHSKSVIRLAKDGREYTSEYAELRPDLLPIRRPYPPQPPVFNPEPTIRFEKIGDRALSVHARSDQEPATIKLGLLRSLGPPSADGLLTDRGEWITNDVIETLWESAECGVDLYLAAAPVRGRPGIPGVDPDVHLILVQHGTYTWDPGPSRQPSFRTFQ